MEKKTTMMTRKTDLKTAPGVFEGFRARTDRDGITFTIVCAADSTASVILYEKGTEKILAEFPVPLQEEYGHIRCLKVLGAKSRRLEYNYRIDGEIVTDPAAAVVVGRTPFGASKERTAHQIRGGFIREDYEWEDGEARPALRPEDVIAYRLHVRGFTKQKNSGTGKKGTFKALAEKIPYLQELGVNRIVLMPVCEFEEMIMPVTAPDETIRKEHAQGLPLSRPLSENARVLAEVNYWGYAPSWYFAPKAGYSAGAPDVELRQMVGSFHKAGIEVYVDFAFPNELPGAFITECLQWWKQTYRIDGFHLMTGADKVRSLTENPLFGLTGLMADYFDRQGLCRVGKDAKEYLTDCNNGFLMDARRMLKGDENQLEAFVARMKGNPNCKRVNYVAGHDGFTLADAVSYNDRHNEANGEENRDGTDCNFSWNCGEEGPSRKKAILELRLRQMKNAMTMLMMAADIPMLLAGDEFGNSQKGNNNPWCQDNEVSWVDWSARKKNSSLESYVRALISLRKEYKDVITSGAAIQTSGGFPAFSCHGSRAWYGGFDYQSRHIGLMQCSVRPDGSEQYLYTAYNCHWDPQQFALPYLPEGMEWQMIMASDPVFEAENKGQTQYKELTVPERTSCILIAEKTV